MTTKTNQPPALHGHQPEETGPLSRRNLLLGTAGLAAVTAASAGPALAQAQHGHSHPASSKTVTPSGSLSSRVYAVVDGVPDRRHQRRRFGPASSGNLLPDVAVGQMVEPARRSPAVPGGTGSTARICYLAQSGRCQSRL